MKSASNRPPSSSRIARSDLEHGAVIEAERTPKTSREARIRVGRLRACVDRRPQRARHTSAEGRDSCCPTRSKVRRRLAEARLAKASAFASRADGAGECRVEARREVRDQRGLIDAYGKLAPCRASVLLESATLPTMAVHPSTMQILPWEICVPSLRSIEHTHVDASRLPFGEQRDERRILELSIGDPDAVTGARIRHAAKATRAWSGPDDQPLASRRAARSAPAVRIEQLRERHPRAAGSSLTRMTSLVREKQRAGEVGRADERDAIGRR